MDDVACHLLKITWCIVRVKRTCWLRICRKQIPTTCSQRNSRNSPKRKPRFFFNNNRFSDSDPKKNEKNGGFPNFHWMDIRSNWIHIPPWCLSKSYPAVQHRWQQVLSTTGNSVNIKSIWNHRLEFVSQQQKEAEEFERMDVLWIRRQYAIRIQSNSTPPKKKYIFIVQRSTTKKYQVKEDCFQVSSCNASRLLIEAMQVPKVFIDTVKSSERTKNSGRTDISKSSIKNLTSDRTCLKSNTFQIHPTLKNNPLLAFSAAWLQRYTFRGLPWSLETTLTHWRNPGHHQGTKATCQSFFGGLIFPCHFRCLWWTMNVSCNQPFHLSPRAKSQLHQLTNRPNLGNLIESAPDMVCAFVVLTW